ncbi:hypothetical protein RND81_13G124200 [Saponaria officinalis]|uniref:Knottins-like domain-containing protein n=1 Tax=Saponaria officinalis TaxID=3572 RepID=A0AAW1H2K6_SAPOF
MITEYNRGRIGPKVVEARMCRRASQKFRGPCVSDNNCENTCATEGYTAGDCHGFRRRCMCSKPCV